RELQANTSPILALFKDQGQRLSSLLAAQEPKNKPLISLTSANGEGHNIWAITESQVVNQIGNSLAEQPLYIADGHHRYESALAYQRERVARSSLASEDEAFNFVMMTLVDFSDPGLIVLPPHRLVRGISKSILNGLMAKLRAFFEIDSINKSKDRPLSRVIFALGILHIGEEMAGLLANHFGSIDKLSDASGEELLSIPTVGPKLADSITAFFRQEQNRSLLNRLRKAGLRLEEEAVKPEELPLAGQEFVITGRLETFARQEA
ncbi:unnamed protein product, partial [marine sediment metagenome]